MTKFQNILDFFQKPSKAPRFSLLPIPFHRKNGQLSIQITARLAALGLIQIASDRRSIILLLNLNHNRTICLRLL